MIGEEDCGHEWHKKNYMPILFNKLNYCIVTQMDCSIVKCKSVLSNALHAADIGSLPRIEISTVLDI